MKVSKLTIKGGGSVSIDENGKVHGATKADCNNEHLQLETEGGGTTIFMGNNQGISTMSFSGGSVVNSFGGGGGMTMVINGVRLTMDDLNRAVQSKTESLKEVEKPKEADFTLSNESCVHSIVIVGASTLTSVDPKYVSKNISCTIKGSGDICLPSMVFDSIAANVMGSGDIMGCNGTTTQVFHGNVMGSGDISRIHVTKNGQASVMGSGDIQITEAKKGLVQKNTSGLGSISVKRK